MQRYINKEIIQSDLTPKELRQQGKMSLEQLTQTLTDFEISFDDWLKKYKESGQKLQDEHNKKLLDEAEQFTLFKANIEKATDHFSGATFSLPAIAGKMGADLYYTVQVPFSQVSQLFTFNEESVPVHLRAQRDLNEKRAEAIADYIEERKNDYTLPALTASVSELMQFEPVDGFTNVGAVKIPMGASLLINDGQHRRRAIEIVLNRRPSFFKDHTISIVMFYDQGLERSQQMFSDINDKMIKPAKALNILFDRQNKLNRIVIDAIEKTGIRNAIEFERPQPSATSSKVWSVSAIKKAIEILTGLNDKKAKELSEDDVKAYFELSTAFLKALIKYSFCSLSDAIRTGNPSMVQELRRDYVVSHAVYLHAVALASKLLCEPFNQDKSFIPQFDELSSLSKFPAYKTADIWQNRIVNLDGTMNPTSNGIKLGAYVVMQSAGLTIPESLQEINDVVFEQAQA